MRYAAAPFQLSQVRLTDGPIKRSQDLNLRYLLDLDADRLLHNFRVNSGIPSSSPPLGGWEAPSCGLRGHFVGHYLSACARMYASTGEATLCEQVEHMVGELARCQAALGNGYLSAFPASDLDSPGRRVRSRVIERTADPPAGHLTLDREIQQGLCDGCLIPQEGRHSQADCRPSRGSLHRSNASRSV